jgi:DNA-binding PadR family transcriptional regulator
VARDYLTDFELMLLLATLRVGDGAYGVTIAREIEASGERTVMLGAVYTGLDRLEANGMVTSMFGAPTPERGGRAKRHFRVTPAGMKAIRQAKRVFTRLWSGVPGLESGRT